jgi:glycerol-3-phosphate acyltransferase PlsY
MPPIAYLALAYLLGSFPSAFIYTAAFRGADIRKVGSGNIGGMNTFRNVGPLPGLLTGLTDLGKGMLAAWLGLTLFPGQPLWAGLGGAAAAAGHNWMPWLGFRGGKGVGATFGALLVLQPWALVAVALIYGAGIAVLRDSYPAVVVAMALLPAIMWVAGGSIAYPAAGFAIAVVVIAKHVREWREYWARRRGLKTG